MARDGRWKGAGDAVAPPPASGRNRAGSHLPHDRAPPNRYAVGMVALRKQIPARMTIDEFLVWDPADRSGRRWQLIDGEPVAMAPASENHGALQGEIARLIGNHLRAHRPGCRLIVSPGVVPRLRANRNFRIPDLGVTCSPPSAEPMLANPVLLIEILSPSNEAETWANIWTYTTIPSVTDILVVRSTRIEAELLSRQADGHWPAEPLLLRAGDTLRLVSIDLAADLKTFYETSSLRA
jgi:Uma2 family endonuclease